MASSLSSPAARLANKTILITGASSGIGRSTTLQLVALRAPGLKLILAGRRLELLQALVEEIRAPLGSDAPQAGRTLAYPLKLDVRDPEQVRTLLERLPEPFAEIDVLINNAGLVKGVDRAPGIKEEDIKTMWETNVTGLINVTQAILPIFIRRGEGGKGDIVNVGSIAGRDPYPGGSIYCASKAAVRAFTEALRKELVASRIRVIGVDPGQVETEFSLVRFDGDEKKAKAVYEGCEPLTPDDVAEVIVFALTRRENVVVADTLLLPSHQAGATVMHRKT
ncbi:MAG: hypothetical protein M1814_000215 [Vezdaea aestivalis]|nr:MAG: hypothetical protein M1814_000215 [Vezdaea aestivalis]